jgi:tol-pal system protein YbgF
VRIDALKFIQVTAAAMLVSTFASTASAGLFDDEEARRAILDLRQRVETLRTEAEQSSTRFIEEGAVLRRSLFDLQNQIEVLKSDAAKHRGMSEQLSRDLSETQRKQKDISQGVDDRFRQFEPLKVTVDGREFLAIPGEKKDFESALVIFRKGDFAAVQNIFIDFIRRYPSSGYESSALFWLGNAQYATRDYKEAMINFRAIVERVPDHLRAAEALLSVANCQVELKDLRGAKKTLEDLVKNYPQSEASSAAKERLLKLK